MSQNGNSPEHIPLDKPINGIKSIGQYYNASRLRADTWDSLLIAVNRLSDRQKQILDLADVEEETVRCFQILETIESFFAFPGSRIFRELKALYEDEDYDTLSNKVTRIVIFVFMFVMAIEHAIQMQSSITSRLNQIILKKPLTDIVKVLHTAKPDRISNC